MNKHLEPEWTLGDENDSHYEVIVGESGMVVDMCRLDRWTDTPVMSRQEMIEVGHLIMAAPKMLKMLKDILRDDASSGLNESTITQAKKLVSEISGDVYYSL